MRSTLKAFVCLLIIQAVTGRAADDVSKVQSPEACTRTCESLGLAFAGMLADSGQAPWAKQRAAACICATIPIPN